MSSRGLVLFALMSVIWGIPYLFIRVVVAEVSPSFLVLARTAIATAILARRLAGLPSVGVMALSLALCGIGYVPIAALQWPVAMPSSDAILSIVVLAVVCTAAAFIVFAALIQEIGPVRSTVITYVN